MKTSRSQAYFKKASKILVGGVHSPVRAFKSVGGTPLAIAKAQGSRLVDLDGNRLIDYVLSWGPMILGHANPAVLKAVNAAAKKGTSFGASHEAELELALLVQKAFPVAKKIRFVNSGTEATMSALRLARAVTQRDLVLKFEGCYHGHADAFLIKAGSGAATLGVPSSPGVPKKTTADTLTLPYNQIASVTRLFKQKGKRIAAVIVEPVAGNMGMVLPQAGFLENLRKQTKKYGALLIFDEVMTGFRLAAGGATEVTGMTPDLVTLGKVIGGGFPAAAFGGSKKIMDQLAPVGPVYQAGTLSGNPVAMAAGIATLKQILKPGFYKKLSSRLETLCLAWAECFAEARVPVQISYVGSMFGIFFNDHPVNNFEDAARSRQDFFKKYFHAMLKEGVYLAPSAFEAGFISSAHTQGDIDKTLKATRRALARIGLQR